MHIDIAYGIWYRNKQHAKVKYLGCILDENLSGESMALNVIDKVNSRLKFLNRQNRFQHPISVDFYVMHLYNLFWSYLRSLCLKSFEETIKISTSGSTKQKRFYLQQDKTSRIYPKEFLELNWIIVHDRYRQFIISDIYNNQCPDYFNDVFCLVDYNRVSTCACNEKLKLSWNYECKVYCI